MKKIALSVLTLACVSSFGVAGGDIEPVVEPVVPMAEEDKNGLYAGLALTSSRTYASTPEYFVDDRDSQDESVKLVGQLGYNFNEYIAIEGRIGGSIYSEDYADVMTYSLFLKPQYPITEDLKIYALLGFGLVQVDGTDGNKPADPAVIGEEILDDTSFQWGLGLSYMINEDFSIFVDYTMLANDADISSRLYWDDPTVYTKLSTDDLTVGLTYNF